MCDLALVKRLKARRAALDIAIAELTLAPVRMALDSKPARTFSAAARRRMSAGMRKYWARRKAQKGAA